MLLNRQKLLLNLINELDKKGIHSRRAIIKSLFILKEEYFMDSKIKFYHFFPYKQGPFSQLCYSDLRKLKNEGLLDEEETALAPKGISCLNHLDRFSEGDINHLLGRFDDDCAITEYVYEKYPEFTVKSELIKKTTKKTRQAGYYTIGYEGRDIDAFLNILIQNGISLIVDVRRNPFSMNFCFIKKNLIKFLKDVDIEYTHIPELGIESEERKGLKSKEDYDKLFAKYRSGLNSKKEYIEKVIGLGKDHKIALLCFEKDASFCHRGEIANFLQSQDYEVKSI